MLYTQLRGLTGEVLASQSGVWLLTCKVTVFYLTILIFYTITFFYIYTPPMYIIPILLNWLPLDNTHATQLNCKYYINIIIIYMLRCYKSLYMRKNFLHKGNYNTYEIHQILPAFTGIA